MNKKISRNLPHLSSLSCGARAVVDSIDSVESLTCGIWVLTGSRLDPLPRAGLAHFYEHMLFKGTTNRDAYRIAADIEACGGMINAYTSHEQTAFYARMPSEHLERGLDILCDMICNARFAEEDLSMERKVITQEIAQSFDQPDDHVFDVFQAQIFPQQRLGRPILGYRDSVAETCCSDLQQHRANHYYGENIVVSFSGNGDFDRGLAFVEKALEGLGSRSPAATATVATSSSPSSSPSPSPMSQHASDPPRFACSLSVEEREIEQCHSVIGFPAFSRHHKDYHAAKVLCALLGQGMASPLFQEIREKRGLAYSIYSFYQAWQDGGIFGLYTASDSNKIDELQRALKDCLQKSIDELSDEDIARAKAQLRSSLVMGLESTSSRAKYWASNLLFHGKLIDPRETSEKIAMIEKSKLLSVAKHIFEGLSAITVLGPLSKTTLSDVTAFGQAH